jgi:hypothetical protein
MIREIPMKMRSFGMVVIAVSLLAPSGCESPSTTTPSGNNNGSQTGTTIPLPPTAKSPAQVVLVKVSAADIAVAGTGATENAIVQYEVRDSVGSPVGATIPVTFTIQFYPNTFTSGGTSPRLMPTTTSTDDKGAVAVTVLSGTQAGVIQLTASLTVGTRVINSSPVRISVHAGFPDQYHFTIAPKVLNFPGLEIAYMRDAITVLVGDKYSNPVVAGTAVYFNTAHGVVLTGGGDGGVTNSEGFVTKELLSANPFPEGSNALPAGNGWSWVYARTKGENGADILDSVRILWTGSPILQNLVGPATFAIPNGGTAGPWTFEIVDKYNHPVSAGMTIALSGSALVFNGNAVDFKMPDAQSSGPGLTQFSFTASDADAMTASIPAAPTAITMTITHPVYRGMKLVVASGTVQ